MSSWKTVNLGEICEIERGGSPRPISEFVTNDEDGVNWIKITDATASGKCIYATEEKIIPDGVKRSRMVYPGDFILSNSMSFGRPYIMQTSGCIHDGWLVLRKPNADTDFLYYILSSEVVSNQFESLAAGSTVRNLNVQIAKEVKIPLPPVAEQRKIAEILRTWDEAIETAEAELKAKQERKRWLMTMVMQKSYETKSVSQFGTLKKGGAILREKLRSEGVPVVLYGDIYTKYSEIVTRLISRVDASAVVDGVKLNSGDIVFAGSGETAEEIGKCIAYVGEEAAYAGGDVVILCNHGQDPRYLGYALNSEDAIRQKMRLGQGSSVMHLYKDDIASIKIPLPPISVQRKVGEILSEADADIELINQRINVLRAQKRGLMQKLLTGEVRVAA